MRITDALRGLGRTVAYHPGLKIITGSTTATILLCQLLYWVDKTKDGWIYKTAAEIEEETGLTKNEQRTAVEHLTEKNLISREVKRLDHITRYRVNMNVFNDLWDEAYGKESSKEDFSDEYTEENTSQEKEEIKAKKPVEKPAVLLTGDEKKEFDKALAKDIKTELYPKNGSKPGQKKKDLVDGLIEISRSQGFEKSERLMSIKEALSKKLHINPNGKRWELFIQFIYNREKEGQKLEKFLRYAIDNGFNPLYWTPEKMETLWPQAFITDDETVVEDDDGFVSRLPKVEEKTYAPMPDDILKMTNKKNMSFDDEET